ncbi:MAG TPA: M48 family metallopeptidase [Pyrinomonadaceae bacterium]
MKVSVAGRKLAAAALAASLLLTQAACGRLFSGGETETGARPAPHFEPGFNLFTPEQDVELGRRSAAEIAQQVPLLRDEQTLRYVRQLGARIAAHAPGEKFPYQFNVIAARELNAFALPGGFIFINAGAITAAKNEGELASVVAHEVMHVALRHGTNQASKAYVAQRGLGVVREVFGDGELGGLVESIGGAGANVVFLRFGRTAERQADLEGARVMAEAGYDPRDMASFFQTLAAQDGRRAPEFLSDHPDPGNRVAAINEALPSLPVSRDAVRDTREFAQVKARLSGRRSAAGALSPTAEPERRGPENPNDMEPAARPARPADTFNEYAARDGSFRLEYPENWDALAASDDDANLIFAPAGAYGQLNQSVVCTHGLFVGAVAAQAPELRAANEAFVSQQLATNADFRVARQPERITLAGREAYATVVSGPSPVSGVREIDLIITTQTADGRLFYLITMAPEDEYGAYQPTFERIINSVRLEP